MEDKRQNDEKLEQISQKIVDLGTKLEVHVKIEESTTKHIVDGLSTITSELKDQRTHFDRIITSNKDHFDNRITTCSDDIHRLLDDKYVTKHELRSAKDEHELEVQQDRKKDIAAAKTEILTSVRQYGAIVFGTITLLIILLGYIFGIKV